MGSNTECVVKSRKPLNMKSDSKNCTNIDTRGKDISGESAPLRRRSLRSTTKVDAGKMPAQKTKAASDEDTLQQESYSKPDHFRSSRSRSKLANTKVTCSLSLDKSYSETACENNLNEGLQRRMSRRRQVRTQESSLSSKSRRKKTRGRSSNLRNVQDVCKEEVKQKSPLNAGKKRICQKPLDNSDDTPLSEAKKQKAPPMPNRPVDKLNFFNKVVKRKGSSSKDYYYVLHFDMKGMCVKLCPLHEQGIFTGKRSGRTRWKLNGNSKIFLDAAEKFEIIATQMVAKTPFVVNETWDILDST